MHVGFFSGDITRSGGTENVSIMLANTLSAGTDYTISFISLFEEHDSPFSRLTRTSSDSVCIRR